ncbi:uncharacterized protein LOC135806802 [Sycon ciliatum]|uniref:uncharacterized protein LOC135806802 n=1 Tax=Sycon ciliatum TaxID=27933 RepID=UPI0031F61569|eukprot:scpid70919/ scgid15807/ 
MKIRTSQGWTKAELEETNAHPYHRESRAVRQPQQSERDAETGHLRSEDVTNSNHHSPAHAADSMDGSGNEEENAPDERHELMNESSYNLDSVIYDVWSESLLPYLDVRSIFRLCGVSRKLRKLLLTEQTFKAICVRRYGISPLLDSSDLKYIDTSKALYVAIAVLRLDPIMCEQMNNHLPSNKLDTMQYGPSCPIPFLPFLSSKMGTFKLERCFPGKMITDLYMEDVRLVIKAATKHLPKLQKDDISRTRHQQIPHVSDSGYTSEDHLDRLRDLSLQRCGSPEVYQTLLIKRIAHASSKVIPLLQYHYRAQRLLKVGRALSSINEQFPELLQCLGLLWSLADALSPDFFLTLPLRASAGHSTLQLYVMNQLDISLENYCMVCLKYRKLRDKQVITTELGWTQFFSGLGEYLRNVLSLNHSDNCASQNDLLDYFTKYAEEVDLNRSSA